LAKLNSLIIIPENKLIDPKSHIPLINTIQDFFKVYNIGSPFHPEFTCMRLEDQPDGKLIHMPLSRVNFYRVLLFTNSKLQFYQGEEKVDTVKNCLCFSYPGKLESWTRSGLLYGYVVYFTSSFSGIDVTNPQYDHDYPFFNFDSESMIPLSDDETQELRSYLEEMVTEMYSDSSDKLEILRKLLHVFLHKVRRVYTKNVSSIPVEVVQSKALFNQFRRAIDQSLHHLSVRKTGSHPTVSTLANELSISANYLNGVVKKLTGRTASAHIQEKLILEAKSYLLHSYLQAAEIAAKLGYENISYFNRFFKKATGHSPLEFRKRFSNL
jgi:AraC family transcriptional activator of pobA